MKSSTDATTANENTHSAEGGGVVIRFYFIRHGQTQANLDGIVVGQLDSPLTDLGIRQAKAAGRSAFLNRSYWRRYTSDLGRAQQTAQLILQELKQEKVEVLFMEKRLRERAKGVREGLSKKLSYDDAVEYRRNRNDMDLNPLYETEDDVWDRVQDWLYEVVGDAVRRYVTEKDNVQQSAATNVLETSMERDGSVSTFAQALQPSAAAAAVAAAIPQDVYSVFCLSHSGALRAVIRKLVGAQLPPEIDLTPAGKDGAKPGMLYIPNTSVTVIDIVPQSLDPKQWDANGEEKDFSQLWTAKLVELTHADHLDTL